MNLQTTLANAAYKESSAKAAAHLADCFECRRAKKTGAYANCREGTTLRYDALMDSLELKKQRKLDKAPNPLQEAMF